LQLPAFSTQDPNQNHYHCMLSRYHPCHCHHFYPPHISYLSIALMNNYVSMNNGRKENTLNKKINYTNVRETKIRAISIKSKRCVSLH
jgi:hypothetical protein